MTETTGTDVLRNTLKVRNKSPNAMAMIAGEIGVGVGRLEDFASGKISLGADSLQALTKVLHPSAEYDATSGLLRSTNRSEAKSIGTPPAAYDAEAHPDYHPAPVGPWTTGGIVLPRTSTSGRITRPPGWA